MAMLHEIRALLVLQDRDRRLMALDKDLEKLPRDEQRERSRLRDDEAAVQSAHDAVMTAELAVKKHELDAQTRRTTIIRLKHQQFETRKNEEFQALAHEITRYEGDLDKLETAELEAMEEVDRLRAELKKAEETLARTHKIVDEDLEKIAERAMRMKAEREEVLAERDRLAAGAPDELLPLYERLMKTKNGLALAPLTGDKCQGCFMKVIPSTEVSVHAGEEVTRCENCGRILYVEG